MGTKFFIYKGKQWLELDTVSGKLDGLRRKPRFLYMKNGTLQVANTSKLLHGLRELAAGRPGGVKCGFRLSQQRRKKLIKKKPRNSLIRPPHCCSCVVRDATVTIEPNVSLLQQTKRVTDAVTQTSLQNSQNTDINVPKVVTPTKTVHPPIEVNRPEPKEKALDSDSSQTSDSAVKHIFCSINDINNIRNLLSKNPDFLSFDLNAFDNDENYRYRILYRLNPVVKINKINLKGNSQKNGEDIDVKQFAAMLGLTHISDKITHKYTYKTRQQVEQITNKYEERKKKRHIQFSSSDEEYKNGQKFKENASKSSDTSSDSSFIVSKNKVSVNQKVKANQKTSDSSSDSPITVSKNKVSDNQKVKANQKTSDSSSDTSSASSFIVSKNKVSDSQKMKANQKISDKASCESKTLLNKLSGNNIREMLGGSSSSSSSSSGLDSDFQSKTRNTMRKAKNLSNGGHQKKLPQLQRRKSITVLNKIAMKTSLPDTNFRSANGRDYSSLEDHAIVAWVSNGGRQRKVNGNTIWRDLQAEYKNITGLSRSWHSLRNRYLRYILPTLSKMCLDPALQTKLRAGAARGEIKLSRKRSLDKHNSLLVNTPVQSAWSRRPKSPSKRPNSPEKRPMSPSKRPNSSMKRENSPVRRPNSRMERLNSPEKRPNSPRKRPNSPTKKVDSPKKRLLSLRKRPITPNNTGISIQEQTTSTRSQRSSLNPSYSSLTKKFQDSHPLRISNSSGSQKIISESVPGLKKTRRLFNPKAFKNI